MTTTNRSQGARSLLVVGAVLLVLGAATLIWGLVDDNTDAVRFGAGAIVGSGLVLLVGGWMGRPTEPTI